MNHSQPASSTNDVPLSFERSAELLKQNSRWLAGGVSSNFRLGMFPHPLTFERAEGAYLFDVDGNRLVDYYLGMGPMILGHSPQSVRDAVHKQIDIGILYAGQSAIEAEAARLFCERVPSAERMRFGSSGSEVVQAAMRVARAATGRTIILKFEGHYHGWFDNILWSTGPALNQAGPAEAPVAVAGSLGQEAAAGAGLEVIGWNDLAALEARLSQGDIAGVIMEAAMCNAGAVAPLPGYLEGVREACTRHGAKLIFDEVITGFRLSAGGAQGKFGVTPDMSVFGKALANGFPVAAIAGKAELLDRFSTGVVHGGTYNAQCIGMAATAATIASLTPEVYAFIEKQGTRLRDGIAAELKSAGIRSSVTGWGPVFHVAFGYDKPAQNYRDLARGDKAGYVLFCGALLRRGVRALERGAWFLSAAHDDTVIDFTLEAVRGAAREVAGKVAN